MGAVSLAKKKKETRLFTRRRVRATLSLELVGLARPRRALRPEAGSPFFVSRLFPSLPFFKARLVLLLLLQKGLATLCGAQHKQRVSLSPPCVCLSNGLGTPPYVGALGQARRRRRGDGHATVLGRVLRDIYPFEKVSVWRERERHTHTHTFARAPRPFETLGLFSFELRFGPCVSGETTSQRAVGSCALIGACHSALVAIEQQRCDFALETLASVAVLAPQSSFVVAHEALAHYALTPASQLAVYYTSENSTRGG